MKNPLVGKISITRPTFSDFSESIRITITDDNAGVEFLEIGMSYSDFTKCITGQAYIPCEFETRGLENVGKVADRSEVIAPMAEHSWKERDVVAAECIQIQLDIINSALPKDEPKWISNNYFGSQDTFFRKDGVNMVRTGLHRWLEAE